MKTLKNIWYVISALWLLCAILRATGVLTVSQVVSVGDALLIAMLSALIALDRREKE